MGRLPRKVLHVMNAAGGGAALSTLGLISELRRAHGVEACVVSDDAGTSEERQALLEATHGEALFTPLYWWNKKTRAKAWKRPALEALQVLKTGGMLKPTSVVAGAAKRFGAELLHTNTFLTPEGALAARWLQLPHVWHVRELIGPGQPFELRLGGNALAMVIRETASMVLANSEASAAHVRALVPEGQLVVVPNGIDLSALAALAPPEGPMRVVMVANLTSRTKRHALFIDAAAQLKGDASFAIYGHTGSDAYVQDLRARATGAGVELPGFAPPEQVLASAHVLVHPAENESFGRTVVEAMAAGRVVIGARGGGVGETIEHELNGLLFEPGSVEALVAALRRVLGDASLRKRLSAAGRQRAIARYSIAACASGVAAAYRQAMQHPLSTPWTSLALLGGLR